MVSPDFDFATHPSRKAKEGHPCQLISDVPFSSPIIADNNAENSVHVVTGNGTDTTAVLDGFTITAGNAYGDCCVHDRGGRSTRPGQRG